MNTLRKKTLLRYLELLWLVLGLSMMLGSAVLILVFAGSGL